MDTSSHPKHLLPETTDEATLRITREAVEMVAETTSGYHEMTAALLDMLAKVQRLLEVGVVEPALARVDGLIELLAEFWVDHLRQGRQPAAADPVDHPQAPPQVRLPVAAHHAGHLRDRLLAVAGDAEVQGDHRRRPVRGVHGLWCASGLRGWRP